MTTLAPERPLQTTREPRLSIPAQAAPRLAAPAPDHQMEVTPLQLTALLEPTLDHRADSATIPCRAYDAELWFAELPADVELAKSLCSDCPVRTACLAGALERREPWGVWGGRLLVQGAIVARKRPRGRPRKCEVAA
jgi:WhiB family transcriptional regulator, redox-sensing transcriptional regulator